MFIETLFLITTTRAQPQMSINSWVYNYGVSVWWNTPASKRQHWPVIPEWITDTHYNIGQLQNNYAKRKKLDQKKKEYIPYYSIYVNF